MARGKNTVLQVVKNLVKKLPIAFTQNQRYDAQTAAIIKRLCSAGSNCIDIGTHKGEILDLFLKAAPGGHHTGFEPIPSLFASLQEKYSGNANVQLYNCALADSTGTAAFNYVTSNPAYSGLKKRSYDRPGEQDESITVPTRRLDDLGIASPIRLIKIDVEGGEMDVLRGSRHLIARDRPFIIFEAGIGGSDVYGTTPDHLFDFFAGLHYRISLLRDFLHHQAPLTKEGFRHQFEARLNYYFIALP